MKRVIRLVFLAALLIRVPALGQSLWLDEATVARVVQQYSFSQIITVFSPTDFHPPFYYLLMKSWTAMAGYSEVALRLPSVIFAFLTGLLLYRMVGIWAALFFLFNPLIVYYSQEARMYMMVTFFLTAALYGIRPSQNFLFGNKTSPAAKNSTLSLLWVNLFILLSLLTFYGSVFFISALYLYLGLKRQFRIVLLLMPGFIIAVAIISPLFVQQFMYSQSAASSVLNWQQVLGPASLKNLLLMPIKFTSGRLSFEPKLLYYFLAGVWSLFINYFVFRGGKNLRGLLFLLVVPIAFGFLISFYVPLLQYFRFLYLIPILILLLAAGTSDKKVHLRGVLLAGFVIWSLVYLFIPQFHREDWRTLARSVPQEPVYMIPSSSDPLLYYRPRLKIKDIRTLLEKSPTESSLIVIPYTADIHGVRYKETLLALGYSQKTSAVRGLTYELWTKE